MEDQKAALHEWIFNYNSIRGIWRATKREYYTQLFSGNIGGVMESKDINTLIELIIKTEGKADKLKQLVHDDNV